MLIPDQIQEDGQPAPGSVRPIHRADVHIIEPQGSELWLDVKIHTVNVDLDVAKELLREEMTKCRAYGQRNGYNLQALDRGMTPVVLEQFGRTAPGAQAIFNRIIYHRLQLLVRQGTPYSFAKQTASSELWGPISCTLHDACTKRSARQFATICDNLRQFATNCSSRVGSEVSVGAGPTSLELWRGLCAEVCPSPRGECKLTISEESFQATPLSER